MREKRPTILIWCRRLIIKITFSNIICRRASPYNYYMRISCSSYADGSIRALLETFPLRRWYHKGSAQWLIHDQFALILILITITTRIGSNLIDMSIAQEVLTTIATLFDSQTYAQQEFLEQWWTEFCKVDLSMIDDLKNIRQLSTRFSLLANQ